MDHSEIAASPAQPLDNAAGEAENAAVAAGRRRDNPMGFARMLATLAFIVALPAALLTTNIRLLASAPLVYDYAFDRYDAELTTGLSRADLDATAKALRNYFGDDEDVFYHTVTEGGLPGPVFNARETQHMADVKDLFVFVNRVQELSVLYVLAYVAVFFIWAREGNVRQLAGQCVAGLAFGMLVVGGVGVFAATGFERAFERFHFIAFSNDLWRLDPSTDHLIQMFPEPFWRDMSVLLGAMCALETAIATTVAGVYLIVSRDERRSLPASIALDHSGTQAA